MSQAFLQGPAALPVSESAHQSALELLRGSSYAPLRSIRCDYFDGDLVLRGQLATFFHKQLAQELVIKVSGVQRVINQIEVISEQAN